jgi:hypothetical protein
MTELDWKAHAEAAELEAEHQRKCAVEWFDKFRAMEARVRELEQIANRYRYAAAWSSADAWDHCSDCRERFAWARAFDVNLNDNEIAIIGRQFLAWRSSAPKEPHEQP